MTKYLPPGDGAAPAPGQQPGHDSQQQHHRTPRHHHETQCSVCSVTGMVADGKSRPVPPLLTRPHHLRTYADIVRIYALTLANGLAHQAAVVPPEGEAPAAFVTTEAWRLMREVDAIRAEVHTLADWLEGQECP
jgi:hypothetical protein